MVTEIVEKFKNFPSEESMSELINVFRDGDPTDEDIAHLAKALADKSDKFSVPDKYIIADIASTGGPTSLSTILCPLYLRHFGYLVPKLGVPGRPAGGIDVMAQLPGYRIALETREINTILTESGYVHCLAGPQHAPLDSELFSYRKKNNAINVPSIAIASLLAKKLVARITVAGLDIRVSTYNNFGKTWAEARINAQCYCRVASILNIKPICFLTNGSVPYQPFIGRGESLAALWEILNQQPSGALTKHQMLCKRMSLAVLNVQPSMANKNTTLKEVFEQNLNSQGSSYTSFVDRVETVLKGHTNTIRSEADGFLSIDLERIRCVIVAAQIKNGETRNTFPDACGLILKHIPGDYVRKDEVLATVRVEPEGQLESVKAEISPALTVVKEHNFHEDQYEEVKLA